MSEAAVEVIPGIVGQIIYAPTTGFASTAEGLSGEFRELFANTAKRAVKDDAERTHL